MIRGIEGDEDARTLLGDELAVLFKSSPTCWLSAMAEVAIRQFALARPDTPVYTLNVVRQREISNRLARDLGVRHESPQVIVLRNGVPLWHASHMQITSERLQERVPQPL